MRTFGLILLALIVLVAGIPLLGPFIGLADYQKLAEGPDQSVRIPAGGINYHQQGTGRDLVLVHGHPGSAQMMTPLAQALIDTGYRVTWYDRSGWGHSSPRPVDQPANPTAHARDLLDLSQALKLSDPIYVGYSYGGGVVMEANRLAPDRVGTIALISSVGPGPRRGQATGLQRILSSPAFLRWAFGLEILTRQASASIASSLVAPETLPEQHMQALLASFALPGVPSTWRREADQRYVGFDNYQPQLVQACTLILHGAQDRVVSVKRARTNFEAIQGARLTEIQDAGHAMVMTQPQRLADRVDTHVRACAAAGTQAF